MLSLSRFMYLMLSASILSACTLTVPLKPDDSQKVEKKHQYVKNYTLGQPMVVTVGEPMIKFQDYWMNIHESPIATLDKTVNIKGGLIDVTLEAGRNYPVRGRISLDGVEYVVVACTDDPLDYEAVLVKPDGTLHNQVVRRKHEVTGGLIPVVYTLTISEPSAKIIRETTQQITSTNGYQSFEIIYSGISSNNLSLMYREFSPEGLARVAFFKNLTYETGAKNITFKKYRISINKATSESIEFTVNAD